MGYWIRATAFFLSHNALRTGSHFGLKPPGVHFPILTGFNMSVNGLSVALREFGISDDSGLKLREAGLDDLDLIAAAFDNVQRLYLLA